MLPTRWFWCCALLIVVVTTAQAESVHREVLASGLVLVVQEFHQTPVVEVRVAVRAGPMNEGPLLGSGASALLQRVLVNSGAGGQSADDVRRTIARLGNHFYAETTVPTAVYGLSITGDQLGDALDLLATLLGNYQYTQADLQREREAILAQPAPSPERFGDLLLASVLYRQHPARLPVTGTPAMLEQVTLDLLRRYQAARYTAATTVMTVVGNVNTNEVRRQVAQAFARYAVGGFQPTLAYIEPAQVGPRYASSQVDVVRPRVTIAWRTESAEHAAQPALALLATVLGDSVLPAVFASAKIDAEVRAELRAPLDQPGALVVGFSAVSAARSDGEQAVYAAVEALAKDGPSTEVLASAKRRMRRTAAARQESARTRAEDLERWELATGEPAYATAYAAAVEAVTVEDVAKVARRYCGDGTSKACTVVLRSGAEPVVETTGRAAEPASSVAPAVIDLGRGLRLIAHPPADVPVVHVLLTLGGALAVEEPQLSGSAAALAGLLPRGAGPRSSADIAALSHATGLEMSSNCDHDGLTVSITCLSDDLDVALELLADLLTRPTLPAAELDLVRTDLLRRIDAVSADRHAQLLAACRDVALAGDTTARPPLGARDVVARLDRSTIEALWKRLSVGSNAVISIAGKYERTSVVAKLSALLAARPSVPVGVVSLPIAIPPPNIPPLSVIFRDAPGAAVALVWKAPARGEALNDDAALAVVTALLAGVDVPGGRINHALAGLPSMPSMGCNAESHGHRGLWILHGEIDLADLDAVPQVVREQVAQLLTQLDIPDSDPRALSAAELITAKHMCLTAHALRQEDATAMAARAAAAVLDGVDPGREAGFPARVAAVTTADVQRVAKTWLSAEPVIVVAKPRAREDPVNRPPTEGAH